MEMQEAIAYAKGREIGKAEALDEVMELIDELNDTKVLIKATPLGSYLHKTYARKLKRAVKALKGGEPE